MLSVVLFRSGDDTFAQPISHRFQFKCLFISYLEQIDLTENVPISVLLKGESKSSQRYNIRNGK